MSTTDILEALVAGRHHDPFAVLGLHQDGRTRVVRTFQPQAQAVALIDADGAEMAQMECVHGDGLFIARMPARKRRYRLRITNRDGSRYDTEDPYRFGSSLGELDLYLLGEGSDIRIYNKLGAQVRTIDGVAGTRFAVWAPNASRVSVIGDFNEWDGRRHMMRLHPGNGIWEIFVPDIGSGRKYKFEMLDRDGKLLPLKSDPFARYNEPPPGNASIVYDSGYDWRDGAWMQQRSATPDLDTPISIYEVHLGSWRRKEHNQYLGYRELANELVDYVSDMGFTHIEFLPVSIFAISSTAAMRKASASSSTGCRRTSRATNTACGALTARRFTSTKTRARASMPTGAR